MASSPRVVAELGRPETAQETADRKAASSQAYRSSKTFRNLIAALLVTVGLVAVVYFGVPRGTPPLPESVDVAAAARSVEANTGYQAVVPDVPESWRANVAEIQEGAWQIAYAPGKGFLRVAQSFDVEDGWVADIIGGYAPTETTMIDGIEWDVYSLPGDAGVRYALSTPAGTDGIIIYGSMTADTAAMAASGLTDQIRALREETP